jgi:ferric-dicitrate binding protein FerR (iron transport regulator)
MPFKVSFGDQGEIEVLGTHFNVNAYADENYINTTLLEGSIRLTLNAKNKISESKILSPGQQALLNKDANKLSITKNEEAESAVAWVKGIFHFEDADIKTVMRQLSRWYNVDVTYEGTIPNKRIMGDAERNIPLSKMLMRLEKMTSVHLVLEGRTVRVTP